MMQQGEAAFVDSGAWIALALIRDPLHTRAVEGWNLLLNQGARLFTSVPIVLEAFTFLERNANRDVALLWKDSLSRLDRFEILECGLDDLKTAWAYFELRDLHKLSAVDATSFAIMNREGIRTAFSFDHHFAVVGFKMVG